MKNVALHLRYMDDLKLILIGEIDEMIQALYIITSGYPSCLILKAKISFFINDFLDMWTYIYPPESKLKIGLQRKKNCLYDITRESSNTPQVYKNAALYTYSYRMVGRTNQLSDYKQQNKINKIIFKNKGKKPEDFPNILRRVKIKQKIKLRKNPIHENSIQEKPKLFGGKIVFDMETNSHQYTKRLVRKSKQQNYRSPILVPGKPLRSFIFTKREFELRISRFIKQ